MEKIVWCWSDLEEGKEKGSDEVNRLLSQGWEVKMISSSAAGAGAGAGAGDGMSVSIDTSWGVYGQAYVVLEKK